MKRRPARHLVLAALLCAGCAQLTSVPERTPEPVRVAGASGPLSRGQSAATVVRAVEDAPDPASMQALLELMQGLSDAPLYKDNEVGLLVDGPQTYAAMLDALNR